MSLEKSVSGDGRTLTIKVGEKFDFSKVQDFRAAYDGLSADVSNVVVDLMDTEYMDSSALGMLLNMQKVLADKVSSIRIVNSKPQVMKILKISRFDKKFTLE